MWFQYFCPISPNVGLSLGNVTLFTDLEMPAVSLALQQCSSGYSSRLSSGRTRVRISLTPINGGVAKVTTVAKARKRCATTNTLCGGSVFMESVLIKNTCFSILPELWCRLAAFGLFGPGFDYISFIFGYF